MAKFQIKLSGHWKDYDDAEDKILKRAYMAGFPNAKFSNRGQEYMYDFKKMHQHNIKSGTNREIRAPYKMKAPEKPIVAPGKTTVVKVQPGWPGTTQYVPHPAEKGAFIAVQVPKNAKPGMTMLVPVPDVTDANKVTPGPAPAPAPGGGGGYSPGAAPPAAAPAAAEEKRGMSAGGKVAAGAAVVGVGGLAVGGAVLGLAAGGVLGDDAAGVADGVIGAAGDAAGAAGDAVGDAAHAVGEFDYAGAAGAAGDAIGDAAGHVGEFAGDAAHHIGEFGADAGDFLIDGAEDVGDFIMDLF
jgi:hypothetical protein